jgi:hypothetical protein
LGSKKAKKTANHFKVIITNNKKEPVISYCRTLNETEKLFAVKERKWW